MASKIKSTAAKKTSRAEKSDASPKKRATTEQIKKANALMMKAWDMISQRNHTDG
jgi:hypothetical protein